MNFEIDPELKNFFGKYTASAKKTTFTSPPKHRPHNHFTMERK